MDSDVLIVGGGVVGLACAAESAKAGYSTLLIERHASFGQETSSRNSEVIHSGIYYPTGSLKAKLCVRANKNLYRECERLGVWHRRCGKLIVAVSEDEESELENLFQRGRRNGVEELEILNTQQVKRLEPNIECRAAMYSSNTGIIDSHELMRAYLRLATDQNASMSFNVEFLGGDKENNGYRVCLKEANGEKATIDVRYVINAAGLSADKVAQSFGIDIDSAGYRLHPNRGHYYSLSSSKSKMISRLVYPLPPKDLVSVGTHLTVDRAGQGRLGPDTEYIPQSVSEREWYRFDDSRKEKFYASVSRYFPALELTDLSPGLVGVRAKLQGPGESMRDFIINEESDKGLPGVVNLIGIESPGLTCAAEIAREAFHKLEIYN